MAFVLPLHGGISFSSLRPKFFCSWTRGSPLVARHNLAGAATVRRFPIAPKHTASPIRLTPSAGFSGGGFLGVGPSEIVVIVAVGWLLLGPQKLFSLAKDSGKLLGELKRTADDAKSTFSEAMDVELMNAELKSDEKAKKGELKGSEGDSANGNGAEKSQFDEITPIMSAKEVPEVSDDDAAESAVLDSVFLDQLKRVSDPQQKAPVNLPDLDVNDGDEFELQRLEEQYLEARKRLEDRRKEVNQRSNTEDVSQNEN